MIKKSIILLTFVVMITSLTTCGLKKKIEDKITEGITEGVMNKVIGDDAEIDLDEGKITFEGSNGEAVVFGTGEWPKDMAADLIPKLGKGTVVTSVNTEQGCMIVLEGIEKDDYREYIEMLANKGFDEETAESSSEDYLVYSAVMNDSEKRAAVILTYARSGKELTISVSLE